MVSVYCGTLSLSLCVCVCVCVCARICTCVWMDCWYVASILSHTHTHTQTHTHTHTRTHITCGDSEFLLLAITMNLSYQLHNTSHTNKPFIGVWPPCQTHLWPSFWSDVIWTINLSMFMYMYLECMSVCVCAPVKSDLTKPVVCVISLPWLFVHSLNNHAGLVFALKGFCLSTTVSTWFHFLASTYTTWKEL